MRYPRSPIVPAIAAGLLFSVTAQAGINATDCTGCSLAQVQALLPRCERGVRYVTDFAAGTLYEGCYELTGVDRRLARRGEPMPMAIPAKRYRWYQPPAGLQNSFQAYLDVYNNNGHVKAQAAQVYVDVDIDPKVNMHADDGYMNAYDTVYATANNDATLHWLDSTTLTTQRISALPGKLPLSPSLASSTVALLNSLDTSKLSVDFHVMVRVVFHDGSTRDYTIDQYGHWATGPDSARDGHGNPIPETRDDVAKGGRNTYAFGGGGPEYDEGNFVQTLTLWAIPVQGDSGATYGCTWDGRTLHCTRSK